MDIEKKNHYIKLFRDNGFNCFPIPNNQKIADSRYQAARTVPNQEIAELENYGIIPMLGKGNCIIDFDDKERYRKFAEHMLSQGYMVIETGRGWHIPVLGLTGNIAKMELFDYNYKPNEKIIEVQGPKHYCVGPCSVVLHDKLETIVIYENKGTDKIWNARGLDFHDFVDQLCTQCQVEGKKKTSTSSYQHMRERFSKGLIPLKGSSNDYFRQAALVCNTDELTREEAYGKIRAIYDKWAESEFFTDRAWSNIEYKINEVYDNDEKVTRGRPAGKADDRLDRTGIAKGILASRQLYSNVETHEIYENKSGFLEKINNTLKRELYEQFPEIEKSDQDSILFKLESGSPDIPPTNKDLIVFKNGVFDKREKGIVETDDLADMGFSKYNYLPKSKENEPTEFMKILYGNTPEYQHPRINAGLRAIFNNRLDSKISVIYGNSGTGKSTPLVILVSLLGDEYGFTVELNQFLNDRATRAKIDGKRLLVFQDLPKEWKDFTTLKTLTGELKKTERGFQQDTVSFDNKLKIWASGNYLAEIPEDEKDSMYTRRLSLVHNTRTEPYEENSEFAEKIIESEGEKIISWIINMSDEECKYEDKPTVQREWEGIASPEIEYLNNHYQNSVVDSKKAVMVLVNECKKATGLNITLAQMLKSLKGLGYVVKNNIITNIEDIPNSQPRDGTLG